MVYGLNLEKFDQMENVDIGKTNIIFNNRIQITISLLQNDLAWACMKQIRKIFVMDFNLNYTQPPTAIAKWIENYPFFFQKWTERKLPYRILSEPYLQRFYNGN